MLNIKADKDGVMIEAEGTTKEMFEAVATAVGGVYKQSIKNAEASIPSQSRMLKHQYHLYLYLYYRIL